MAFCAVSLFQVICLIKSLQVEYILVLGSSFSQETQCCGLPGVYVDCVELEYVELECVELIVLIASLKSPEARRIDALRW